MDRWTKCLGGDSEWTDLVFLPLQNPFVPTDFTIKTSGLKAAAVVDNTTAAVTAGVSEIEISRTEQKAVPGLIDHVTTVSEDEIDDAEDETVTTLATDVISATAVDSAEGAEPEVTPAAATEAAEATDEGEEEEEEEEGEEEPAGQLPPPQGKVRTPATTTYYTHAEIGEYCI